jgi:hypothetical protein
MPSSTAGFSQEISVMKQEDELAIKVTKEIVIKFIEVGRLSLSTFDETFRQVHSTVLESLKGSPCSKDLANPGVTSQKSS